MDTIILFVIGFTLQALSFLFIILLYMRFSKLKEVEKQQEKTIREVENAVTGYIVEMKDENDQFLKSLQRALKENKEQRGELKIREASVQIPKDYQAYEPKTRVEKKKEIKQTQEVSSNISYVDQVFLLSKQGKSVEEISKLLDKGQTEIELLLSFRSM